MKNYTKIYYNYLDYPIDPEYFVPCEICQCRAVDIHHIENRYHRPDLINNIENLMALCRKCHDKYGDITKYKPMLKKIHLEYINNE